MALRTHEGVALVVQARARRGVDDIVYAAVLGAKAAQQLGVCGVDDGGDVGQGGESPFQSERLIGLADDLLPLEMVA